MRADPVTREIDGLVFEIRQLGVRDARAAFVRLSNALGPALSEFSKAEDAVAAVGKVFTDLSVEDLDAVYALFAKGSKVQLGGLMVALEGAGDTVFQGSMLTMFKWMWASAEVNYADFLDGFKGMNPLASLGKKAPSASTSQPG